MQGRIEQLESKNLPTLDVVPALSRQLGGLSGGQFCISDTSRKPHAQRMIRSCWSCLLAQLVTSPLDADRLLVRWEAAFEAAHLALMQQ
jgi:hypothetical protein